MRKINDNLYVNDNNISNIEQIEDNYYLTTSATVRVKIDSATFEDLKEYEGGGGVSNTMLTTTTDATKNSGTYTLDLTYLSETPKVNDYVVYVNSGNLTILYQVSAVGSTNATLTKVGDIGGGKQLYQHNINIYDVNYHITFIIPSEKSTALTKDEVKNFIQSKFSNRGEKLLHASGWVGTEVIAGIFYSTYSSEYTAKGSGQVTWHNITSFDNYSDTIL